MKSSDRPFDVMVVFGRPKGERGSYMQWQEDNVAPQVAFEILSPGNTKKEMEAKFEFYQKHGIEEYYLYNPKKNRLQGWLRKGKKLEAIAQIENWISPLLGIRLTTGEGELVLFHPDGERFVEFVEVVEQRDRALERADRQKQRAIFAENERDRQQQRATSAENERDRERLEKESKLKQL
ncbi:MAG: Uma2 family endonuclease [Cyanobacteria bacterium P01_E01_bin.42]